MAKHEAHESRVRIATQPNIDARATTGRNGKWIIWNFFINLIFQSEAICLRKNKTKKN